MSPKLKLEYEPDYDFLLLGIVSFERDYRLSWEMNARLGLDLVRTEDHKLSHPKTRKEQLFSCFVYEDEDSYLSYKLLSNKSDMGFLLDSLKNIDFLLVVSGEYYDSLATDFRSRLLGLDTVQACFVLDPQTIRHSMKVL